MMPMNNISAPTYRDGLSYTRVLEQLKVWLNTVLVPEFNAGIDNAFAQFAAGLENIENRIIESETQYDALINGALQSVADSITENKAYTDEQAAAARQYVDDAIQFINNKTGQAQIQRTTLIAPYTVTIDPLWPNNHPIQIVLTQDAVGGRPVTMGPNITGVVDVDPTPNTATEFTLLPIGGGIWRVVQEPAVAAVTIERNRRPGDVSDKDRFQRAVDKAKASGSKEVIAPVPTGGAYLFHERVDVGSANNLTIRGVGNKLVQLKAAPGAGEINLFSISAGFKNLRITGFDFVGAVVENPTVPTRARTYGADRMKSAIWFNGDLGMTQITTDVIENLTFDNNRVYGSSGLPLWLSGLRGTTRIHDNTFDNNYDIGLMYLDNAYFHDNRILNSRDNGVSVSRGCKNVFVHNNYIQNACYWGIWTGGFLSTGTTQADRDNPANWGPSFVIVSDNIVNGSGYGGVYASVGPKSVQIHDNTFLDGGSGPVDAPNDQYGVGVYIGGLSNSVGGYSTWAEDIHVHHNIVNKMSRGGVYIGAGSRRIMVDNNQFKDIGWQFLANGTTEVLGTDATRNYGVYVHLTTDDVEIINNKFRDTRATPYFNKPIISNGGTNLRTRNNTASGNRIPLEETTVAILTARKLGLTNAATDAAPRATLDYDGANLTLNMLAADGVTIVSTPFKVRVSDGVTTLGNTTLFAGGGVRLPVYTTATRPTGAQPGQMIFDSDLAKAITFSGANWRDGAHNIV